MPPHRIHDTARLRGGSQLHSEVFVLENSANSISLSLPSTADALGAKAPSPSDERRMQSPPARNGGDAQDHPDAMHIPAASGGVLPLPPLRQSAVFGGGDVCGFPAVCSSADFARGPVEALCTPAVVGGVWPLPRLRPSAVSGEGGLCGSSAAIVVVADDIDCQKPPACDGGGDAGNISVDTGGRGCRIRISSKRSMSEPPGGSMDSLLGYSRSSLKSSRLGGSANVVYDDDGPVVKRFCAESDVLLAAECAAADSCEGIDAPVAKRLCVLSGSVGFSGDCEAAAEVSDSTRRVQGDLAAANRSDVVGVEVLHPDGNGFSVACSAALDVSECTPRVTGDAVDAALHPVLAGCKKRFISDHSFPVTLHSPQPQVMDVQHNCQNQNMRFVRSRIANMSDGVGDSTNFCEHLSNAPVSNPAGATSGLCADFSGAASSGDQAVSCGITDRSFKVHEAPPPQVMQNLFESRNRITLWLDYLIPDGGKPTDILDNVLDNVPVSQTAGIAPVPSEPSPEFSQLRGATVLDPFVQTACVSEASDSCPPVNRQMLFQTVPCVSQMSPIVWQNAAGNHCCMNGDVPNAGARILFHAKPDGQLSFVRCKKCQPRFPRFELFQIHRLRVRSKSKINFELGVKKAGGNSKSLWCPDCIRLRSWCFPGGCPPKVGPMSNVAGDVNVNFHEPRDRFSGDIGMAIPCLSAEHSFEGSGSASPNVGMAIPRQSVEHSIFGSQELAQTRGWRSRAVVPNTASMAAGASPNEGVAIPCINAEYSFEGSGSASPNEGMAIPCQSAENVDVDWKVRHNIGALSEYAEDWMQNAVMRDRRISHTIPGPVDVAKAPFPDIMPVIKYVRHHRTNHCGKDCRS